MRTILTSVALLALAAGAVADEPGPQPTSALVPAFNERLFDIAVAEDGLLTLKGVRTAAMMHIAMHDALAATGGPYEAFVLDAAGEGADPAAAAAHAAFAVAVDQYPDRRDDLAVERDRWLALTGGGEAAARLGRAAAAAILESRADDGWDNEPEYRWHPMAPGVYAEFAEHSNTPEGFIFGAGWGTARPFALPAHDHFRAPPPPAISSAEYTAAFDEVKIAGRFQSPVRTIDQTHLALWWKDFAERSHNRLARELVQREALDLHRSARLFALLNVAIFDAYVSVFDNKFHYNHWRPYTAIRWAENDGNPDTAAEPTWTNLHRHTYAFPSYPSAHGTACAAAMGVLADTFGDDYAFTMTTATVDLAGPFSGKIEMMPPTRTFGRFSDAAMECAMSRVYLGIHFRYDSVEGNRLGRLVGDYVVANEARPRD